MTRSDQLNAQALNELAQLANQRLIANNFLITFTSFNLSPDFSQANVKFSVLPDKFFGQVLRLLRRDAKYYANELRRRLGWRRLPLIIFQPDKTEKEAAEIEMILKLLKKEKKDKLG